MIGPSCSGPGSGTVTRDARTAATGQRLNRRETFRVDGPQWCTQSSHSAKTRMIPVCLIANSFRVCYKRGRLNRCGGHNPAHVGLLGDRHDAVNLLFRLHPHSLLRRGRARLRSLRLCVGHGMAASAVPWLGSSWKRERNCERAVSRCQSVGSRFSTGRDRGRALITLRPVDSSPSTALNSACP